jgi:UDP-glucuronate decarboxylase
VSHLLQFTPATRDRILNSGLDVVLTGAGGWLGQATLEMLEASLGTAINARVHVFASSHRSMELRSGAQLEVLPLTELRHLNLGPHVLIHYAFATRELVSRMGAAKYISCNEEITDIVAGHLRKSRPIGSLFLSSGAVYLGDDLATNPYGVLKARDERRFFDIIETLGRAGPAPKIVVPRLFNLAGPFLNKPSYVLGSIIRDIINGGPIRLNSQHHVVRSYIHVADLVELAFAMMLSDGPSPHQAFDTAGEREIEVSELAELASNVLGERGVLVSRPPLDGTPQDRYVGDPTVMNSLARAYGIEMKELSEQIKDTARFLSF